MKSSINTLGATFPAGVITQYHVRKQMRSKKAFKDLNKTWDMSKFGWYQHIGRCMPTIREHRPQTFADWVEVYFTHCKTWAAISALGRRYAGIAGIDEQTAIAHVIIHSIDETWDGYHGELIAEKMMKQHHAERGETVLEATADEDFEYSIDFVVKNGDATVCGIQVKPNGFFYSNRIQSERDRYKIANQKFIDKTGAPVYYINIGDAERGLLNYIPLKDIA